jgi:hypothetical protein
LVTPFRGGRLPVTIGCAYWGFPIPKGT